MRRLGVLMAQANWVQRLWTGLDHLVLAFSSGLDLKFAPVII